jgi:hypothetical protein
MVIYLFRLGILAFRISFRLTPFSRDTKAERDPRRADAATLAVGRG